MPPRAVPTPIYRTQLLPLSGLYLNSYDLQPPRQRGFVTNMPTLASRVKREDKI